MCGENIEDLQGYLRYALAHYNYAMLPNDLKYWDKRVKKIKSQIKAMEEKA